MTKVNFQFFILCDISLCHEYSLNPNSEVLNSI